jgi:asparagine synthetase A
MKNMCSNARFFSDIAPDFTISIESPVESFEQPPEEVLEENDNKVPASNKRRRIAKSFGDDFIVYLVDDTSTSITEAYASPDADDWKEVVRSEMDSILSNGT